MKEIASDCFLKELEALKLHTPGGRVIPFNNEDLISLFHIQHPNWKHDGRVSWVPTDSDPRHRGRKTPLSIERQKRDRFQQKREYDKSKLHKLLVGIADLNQEGITAFPDITTREVFQTPMAKVQMDLVLAHSAKGLFVFNVYSQPVTEMTATTIQTEADEHFNFLRAFLKYRHEELINDFPIHTVVCLPRDDNKRKVSLLEKMERGRSRTLIFKKSELKPGIFSSLWKRKLKELPDLNEFDSKAMLDISVARLSFLSSIQSFKLLNYMPVSKTTKMVKNN